MVAQGVVAPGVVAPGAAAQGVAAQAEVVQAEEVRGPVVRAATRASAWAGAARAFLVILLCLLATGAAVAERVEIDASGDPNSRLEIRNVVLPGGEEVQLYVVQGDPVRVTIGERRLVANHIEVDLESRVVRIVGFGTFITPEQTVQGDDLFIELEAEAVSGDDVLIITDAIDVRGARANRMPGQIDVLSGSFSPCSRCAQEVEDYGFRAERIHLYPGDRLVAFGVTMLVRETPLLQVPLLVLPLARPDRQPRLAISQGTAVERAQIALDWPYVAGPNAYGTFSVRYWADVNPSLEGGFHPLGGRIVESYLGGGIDHIFYTERGQGNLVFFYRPGFLSRTGGERERSQFTVLFAYATEDELEPDGPPAISLEVVRDDERRQRLVEYEVELESLTPEFTSTVRSRGFADLDPDDSVTNPSYDGTSTPRRTPLRYSIEPVEASFTVGPLVLRRLALDLGVFEDASNPGNRSAAGTPFIQAGRALERHALELTPIPLWEGMQISGFTNFQGQYYTTGERLIDWNTQVSADQRLGDWGSFGVVYRRDTSEGETPFRFDLIPLRTRSDITANLRLDPLSWLTFRASGGYVIRDSRRPELEGFMPLETRLELFNDLRWLEASVANSYDIEENDPGMLQFRVTLRNPETEPQASITFEHDRDLAVRPDRLTGELEEESETRMRMLFGHRYLRVDASGGYRYNPQLPDEGELPQYWLPFEVGLTVGTTRQDDHTPGLRIAYERNLNERRVQALSYQATARVWDLEFLAEQRFDLPGGGTSSSTVRLGYPDVAQLEATGFDLIPPTWLGLPEGEPEGRRYAVTLRDLPPPETRSGR